MLVSIGLRATVGHRTRPFVAEASCASLSLSGCVKWVEILLTAPYYLPAQPIGTLHKNTTGSNLKHIHVPTPLHSVIGQVDRPRVQPVLLIGAQVSLLPPHTSPPVRPGRLAP